MGQPAGLDFGPLFETPTEGADPYNWDSVVLRETQGQKGSSGPWTLGQSLKEEKKKKGLPTGFSSFYQVLAHNKMTD